MADPTPTPQPSRGGGEGATVSWRCFHCDEVFTNRQHALEHFGDDESATVACKLTRTEGHLVTLIRKLQRELASYRREDNHVLRAWFSKEDDHAEALRREEEKGYNRGVTDAKKMFEAEAPSAPRGDGELLAAMATTATKFTLTNPTPASRRARTEGG